MKLRLKYLFCLLIGAFLFSCQKDDLKEKLLKQAQSSLVVGKPDIALNLLDSIKNPEKMDKDDYMKYIVAYVGAKKEIKADIAQDTLIFDAQSYFNDKGDSQNSALANYYSGWVYYVNNKLSQSLESFMYGANTADKSENHLLAAKNFNNIGYIYFEQDIFDSAIVNYQKALFYYDKVENLEQRKLETLTYIGSAYEALNKLDSSYLYFDKCLSLAKETNNKTYEFYSLKNLGVVCYGMKDYDKSIEYFQSALSIDVSKEVDLLETSKIHLYLLNIYNKKGDVKSAKQYADLVIADLPEVTYKYTSKEMYASLAEYYKQLGDYEQAFQYSEQEKIIKEQIAKETDAPALLAADKNYYLVQKEREVQEFKSHINFLLIIGLIIFCVILAFVLFVWRDHKKDKAEIRECADKYEILKGLIYSMGKEYPQIEAEIKSMLADE